MGGKWNEVDGAIAGLDVEQLIARHQLSAASLLWCYSGNSRKAGLTDEPRITLLCFRARLEPITSARSLRLPLSWPLPLSRKPLDRQLVPAPLLSTGAEPEAPVLPPIGRAYFIRQPLQLTSAPYL